MKISARLGAALAYYTVFSLAPLLIIIMGFMSLITVVITLKLQQGVAEP